MVTAINFQIRACQTARTSIHWLSDIHISHGSVAMRSRCGEIISDHSITCLPRSPLVKEFCKFPKLWAKGQCPFFVSQVMRGSAITVKMKKTLRETQTLRAGCSKTDLKKFRPVADPLPVGAGWPKFNQLEMVTTFTYKPSLELSW